MIDTLPEVLAMLGGFAGSVGVVAGSTRIYLAAKRNEIRRVRTPFITTSAKSFTEAFNSTVDALKTLIDQHHVLGYKKTASKMRSILVSTDELFERIQKKGTNDQLTMASVKYAHLFEKVAFAMNDDHYIDIAKNPGLWEEPEQRLKEAENALDSVHKQIIDNIKQVNSSKDLDFKIALEALTAVTEKQNVMEEIFIKEKIKDVTR